jgi:hypothetical protein
VYIYQIQIVEKEITRPATQESFGKRVVLLPNIVKKIWSSSGDEILSGPGGRGRGTPRR